MLCFYQPQNLVFQHGNNPGCFVYNGSRIVQQPIRYENLTANMITDFRRFIDNKDPTQPFFFYFSFVQVKTELFSRYTEFAGKSARGGCDFRELLGANCEICHIYYLSNKMQLS